MLWLETDNGAGHEQFLRPPDSWWRHIFFDDVIKEWWVMLSIRKCEGKNNLTESSRPSLLGSAAAGLKNLVEISIDRIGIGRIACRHSTRNGHQRVTIPTVGWPRLDTVHLVLSSMVIQNSPISIRSSQAVYYPSTALAIFYLSSMFKWVPVYSLYVFLLEVRKRVLHYRTLFLVRS